MTTTMGHTLRCENAVSQAIDDTSDAARHSIAFFPAVPFRTHGAASPPTPN